MRLHPKKGAAGFYGDLLVFITISEPPAGPTSLEQHGALSRAEGRSPTHEKQHEAGARPPTALNHK
jgi:hypothetical protein